MMNPFIIHNITTILPDNLLPNARIVVREGCIAESQRIIEADAE